MTNSGSRRQRAASRLPKPVAVGSRMRNSECDPLRIDEVIGGDNGGRIGITLCPGKHDRANRWERDLARISTRSPGGSRKRGAMLEIRVLGPKSAPVVSTGTTCQSSMSSHRTSGSRRLGDQWADAVRCVSSWRKGAGPLPWRTWTGRHRRGPVPHRAWGDTTTASAVRAARSGAIATYAQPQSVLDLPHNASARLRKRGDERWTESNA